MERADAWRLTEGVTHEPGRGDPFAAAVRATRMPMIITDPRQHDNPIVFANDAFLNLTGYDRSEVMGANCRFLQGSETDRQVVKQIAKAIASRQDVSVDLLNYRKDGSSFWNALYMSPVFGDSGDLRYFFASQLDVTERMNLIAAKTALLREVDHRVKNNLQSISSFIVRQMSNITDVQVRKIIDTVLDRLTTMSTVHQHLYQSQDVTRLQISGLIGDIVDDLLRTTGRDDIAIHLDLTPVDIPAERAAPLALIVNELVTNVFKHALPPDRPGAVRIKAAGNGERIRIEIEDDGLGMPEQPAGASPSFGQNLVRLLARHLKAGLTWSDAEPSGTRVVLDMPAG